MDNWIFRPVKKSGVIAYQVRNERNGLCVELRNYDVTQGPCQANVETSQTQTFWLETSGSYTYLVLADLPRLVVTVMPGSTYLTLTDKTFLPPTWSPGGRSNREKFLPGDEIGRLAVPLKP